MDDNFCSAPWTHLFLDPRGDVRTCCNGKQALGNINQTPIQDIIGNDLHRGIRQSVLDGKWHDNCATCQLHEARGNSSQRSAFQQVQDRARIKMDHTKSYVSLLDLRWNNTCNLACNYCSPYFSNTWGRIEGQQDQVTDPNSLASFRTWVIDNISGIKKVWLIGGEPLLMPEHVNVVEVLPADTRVELITNLSLERLEKNRLYKSLQKFDHVKWHVSFENVGDRFEYVRHGAQWATMQHNLSLLADNERFSVGCHAVYNAYSAFDLENLYRFLATAGIKEINWSGLSWPTELDAYNLPQRSRELAVQHIERVLAMPEAQSMPVNGLDQLRDIQQGLLFATTGSQDLSALWTWSRKLEEKLPKQHSLNDLWPELGWVARGWC